VNSCNATTGHDIGAVSAYGKNTLCAGTNDHNPGNNIKAKEVIILHTGDHGVSSFHTYIHHECTNHHSHLVNINNIQTVG
jgi:hypothetical protein